MKKISLLKNTLFWEAPYAFKEPGETKYKSKYASNGSTITPIFIKFDKTGSVHNAIRKNKESSQKKKNAISNQLISDLVFQDFFIFKADFIHSTTLKQ